MGQAKRRGALQQRRWLAIEKKRKDREALGLMQIEAEAKRHDADDAAIRKEFFNATKLRNPLL